MLAQYPGVPLTEPEQFARLHGQYEYIDLLVKGFRDDLKALYLEQSKNEATTDE